MGEVYRAIDSVLGRTVAVKLLSERHAHEPEARARFRREALAAARLSGSKHVVTIFDVGEHRGRPLIVMEFVAGGSVHDRLREGRVPREQALTWLGQAAEALDRAHAQGVIHRDVKPANLLLDGDGNVHVSDFGIASTTGLDTLTLPGTILGTVGYLAPEQARGEVATPASDRYGLAVVAFELLTGRRPFESETATTEVLAHLTAPVPRASSVAPELPPEVDAVFRRALAKDPSERPATCAGLVGDLRRALLERPEDLAPTVVLPPPSTGPVRRRSVRVGQLPGIAFRAILVAAATALVLLLVSMGDRNTAERGGRSSSASAETTEQRAADTRAPAAVDGVQSNDRGYARMQAGDFAGALPLLRRAVLALSGTGSLTEAYASYNLAYARFALGRCDGVTGLLDRSERIQGYRREIEDLRARWQERCVPPAVEESDHGDDRPGKGKGRGNGKGEGR